MKKRIYKYVVVDKNRAIVGRHTTEKLALRNIHWKGDHVVPYSQLPKHARK